MRRRFGVNIWIGLDWTGLDLDYSPPHDQRQQRQILSVSGPSVLYHLIYWSPRNNCPRAFMVQTPVDLNPTWYAVHNLPLKGIEPGPKGKPQKTLRRREKKKKKEKKNAATPKPCAQKVVGIKLKRVSKPNAMSESNRMPAPVQQAVPSHLAKSSVKASFHSRNLLVPQVLQWLIRRLPPSSSPPSL